MIEEDTVGALLEHFPQKQVKFSFLDHHEALRERMIVARQTEVTSDHIGLMTLTFYDLRVAFGPPGAPPQGLERVLIGGQANVVNFDVLGIESMSVN